MTTLCGATASRTAIATAVTDSVAFQSLSADSENGDEAVVDLAFTLQWEAPVEFMSVAAASSDSATNSLRGAELLLLQRVEQESDEADRFKILAFGPQIGYSAEDPTIVFFAVEGRYA